MSFASLDEKTWWEGMEFLEIFEYRTVVVQYFTDQNWIPKTAFCIRRGMVWKIDFTNWNAKITLLHASMVVTYYIKLFQTGANGHNGILMSLLLLVTETTRSLKIQWYLRESNWNSDKFFKPWKSKFWECQFYSSIVTFK